MGNGHIGSVEGAAKVVGAGASYEPTLASRVLVIEGLVQGVGFRAAIARQARALGVRGAVWHDGDALRVQLEGDALACALIKRAIVDTPPAGAMVSAVREEPGPLPSSTSFVVGPSDGVRLRASVGPDVGICAACRDELLDARSRRARDPFISCVACGPRASLAVGAPWDRERTTMARFAPCAACAHEFADPDARRYQDALICCPGCGPTMRLLDVEGIEIARGDDAMLMAARALAAGRVVAAQGIGGFEVLADAADADIVRRIHERLGAERTWALMPAGIDAAERLAFVDDAARALLQGPTRPVVVVPLRPRPAFAALLASAPSTLGVQLPASGLHHLLVADLERPLLCVEARVNDAATPIDADAARAHLRDVADVWLVHDRAIVRPFASSVVQPGGRAPVVRRARGLAPRAIPVDVPACPPVLAIGTRDATTTTCIASAHARMSPALGALAPAAWRARVLQEIEYLVDDDENPVIVACDLQDDTGLASTLADRWGAQVAHVQHHHAHVAAVCAEHALHEPVTGFAWDDAGVGVDGTLWGGETLRVRGGRFERAAWLRPFPLLGGGRGMRDPLRAAWGALANVDIDLARRGCGGVVSASAETALLALLRSQQRGGTVEALPLTSSIARLIDAVAVVLGVCATPGVEGRAARALEAAAGDHATSRCLPWLIDRQPDGTRVVDPGEVLRALVDGKARGVDVAELAAAFLDALAHLVVMLAQHEGRARVVLAGNVFSNRRLLRTASELLVQRGFEVFTAQELPLDDGALSLGQAWVAAHGGGELAPGMGPATSTFVPMRRAFMPA